GAGGRAHACAAGGAEVEAAGGGGGQERRADLLGRAAVADRKLGRLDVTVGGAPRDRGDAALAQDRQPLLRLGGRHEVDRDPRLAAPRDLAAELRGVALVTRHLEGTALRETARLARRVGERREFYDRAAGRGGECGGGA